MKYKKVLLILGISVAIFSACTVLDMRPPVNQRLLGMADHSQTKLQVLDKKITVEVVNTQASTMQGLSDRSAIGADGMLFIFADSSYQQFWMKDMKFNLDMIWLQDLTVVDISENVPKPFPGEILNQLPLYAPKRPINEVLEVPAGTSQVWKLKVGDVFVPSE